MNGHAIKQYGELLLLHFLDPTMTRQQVTNVNGPRFQYCSAQLIYACQCYQNCMWSSNSITNVFQAKMVMRPDCEMVHPCELWMWIYRVKCVVLCGDVNGFAGFYQEISCNWLYWLQCCDVIPDENLGYCVILSFIANHNGLLHGLPVNAYAFSQKKQHLIVVLPIDIENPYRLSNCLYRYISIYIGFLATNF